MNDLLLRIIADYTMFVIIGVAIWALITKVPARKRFQTYVRIGMAGLTTYFVAKVVALYVQPGAQRPFELMGVEPGAAYLNNPGFPSDHALFAVFLTVIVWCAVKNRRLGIIMAAFTLLVCVGRVLALVHTPLDILGGILIGLLAGLWFIEIGTNTGQKRKNTVQ